MASTQERWDKLPIAKRIKIAESAGREGKIGSSDWEHLYKDDKEALIKWDGPEKVSDLKKLKPRYKMTEAERVEAIADGSLDPKPTPRRRPSDSHQKPLIDQGQVREKAQDYLLWVGWRSYPTVRSFTDETSQMGVSRRISKIPNGLVLGRSKIFMAHDEGETGDAVIFGYFIPTSIEMITFDGESSIPKELNDRVTPITLEQANLEPERGCGFRTDMGALYLVSLKGSLVVIDPAKDYNKIIDGKGRRFRGIKKVDGEKILIGIDKSLPSIRHRVKANQKTHSQKGDRWTEPELALLRKYLSQMRPQRAFREIQKITGRSIHAAEYQHFKMRKTEAEAE